MVWLRRKPVIFERLRFGTLKHLGGLRVGMISHISATVWRRLGGTPGTDTGVLQNCSYTTDGRVVQRPIVDVHSGTENFIV